MKAAGEFAKSMCDSFSELSAPLGGLVGLILQDR
jgi:hypothetical protein